MAGHEWEGWFEREELIGQISDIRVQNLQVERENVQKRTFTRWMNLHLEKCDPPMEVHDLFRDIQDGRILMALLEELSGCKLLHGFKKSSHRIFRLNNIAKVLSFLEERNVKLVSIDASDVADGNSSIVLGLIWNIILFFQIKELTGNIRSQFPSSSSLSSIPTSSDSDASHCSTPSEERRAPASDGRAIKKLLQWVQKRTRKYGVAVKDFGKSWTSGLAFLAVIKAIDPSLVDMRRSMLRTPRENLEDAFRTAHYSLGIARLLEPEDVTINPPDEQSIMTYVSQFLEHFPGMEEPTEEPSQVIERSVSMGRLSAHDSESDMRRNGVHRSRLKERPYPPPHRDCVQPPPKIFISALGDGRRVGGRSPASLPSRTRAWASEDSLADPAPGEEDSSSAGLVAEAEPPDARRRSGVFTVVVGGSESPRSSYVESVVGSSETESAAVDSAIGSPDSWLGGEALGGEAAPTPERLGESRSDVSLCDSGVAWDAGGGVRSGDAPEDDDVTALGEGLGATTGKPQDRSLPELFIDEGVYSLSSMESTQDRIQECSERDDEDLGQNEPPKDVPDRSGSEDKGGTDSEQVDASPLGKDPMSNEKRASLDISEAPQQPGSGVGYSLEEPEGTNPAQAGFGDKPLASDIGEEPKRRGGVVASTDGESECAEETVEIGGGSRDNEGRSHVENESVEERESSVASETNTVCQRKESVSEAEMEELGVLMEMNEGATESVERENEMSHGVLNGHVCLQENAGGETIDAGAQIDETIEDTASLAAECPSANEGGGASKSHLDPGSSTRLTAPRSVPRDDAPDQGDHRTCGPGREGQAGGEALEPTGSSGRRHGYETDVNGTERLSEISHDSGEQIHSKSIRCALCRNGGPAAEHAPTQQTAAGMENGHFGDVVVDPRDPNVTASHADSFLSVDVDIKESQQKGDDDHASDIIGDDDITAPLPPGLESHGLHPDRETTTTDRATDLLGARGDTPPPSTDEPTGDRADESLPVAEPRHADRETAETAVNGNGDVGGVVDTFYLTNADRSSPLDELDPMDLFYPDNDDSGGVAMFPEEEEEEESHGSPVFSVLALQPAPASVTPPPDTPDSLREAHRRRSPTDEATRRADGPPGEEGDFGRAAISSTQSQQITGGGRRELSEAPESEDEEPWEGSLLDPRGGEVTAGGTGIKPSESRRLLLLLGESADLTPPGPETEEDEGQNASCARANTEAMSSGAQNTSGVDDGLTCMVLRRRKGAASTEPKDNQRDASTSKVHSNGSELRRRGGAPEASNELYLLLLLWMLLYCAWLLPQMDLQALPSLLFNMEH